VSGRWIVVALVLAALAACGDNLPQSCGNFEAGGLVVHDGNIYWTDDNGGAGTDYKPLGFVWRRSLSNGATTRFATVAGYPDRMTNDATALYVGGGCGGGVWKVPFDGSPGAMIAQVASDDCINGVAVDQQSVYFTSGAVWKAPLAGGSVEQLVPPQPGGYGCSNDLVVDATRAFWASDCYNTLSAVSLAGGPVTVIDHGSTEIGVGGYQAVARDETNLYWAGDGALKSMPLAGGPISTIATVATISGAKINSIAVDATSVYWTATGGLFTAPRAGGPALQLVTAERQQASFARGDGPGLAFDDTRVYWSAGCEPESTPK
jgi:hypothetical protein